jgi:hypothetical protein
LSAAQKTEVTCHEMGLTASRDVESNGQVTTTQNLNLFASMSRDELLRALEMFAKNWLAHDGCWFLAAEDKYGMETAIELDGLSWKRFAAAEARRIMSTFQIAPNGGLEALEKALGLRMYSIINSQRTEWSEDRRRFRFFMDACRVQQTRKDKGLAAFPCKQVGVIEFETFAKTVDARIQTVCLRCPPDAPEGMYCGWEFSIE